MKTQPLETSLSNYHHIILFLKQNLESPNKKSDVL